MAVTVVDGYEAEAAEVAAILAEDLDPEDHADPSRLYARATSLHARYEAVLGELSRLRAEAVARLHADGLSYARISAHLGISRGRVAQLARAGRSISGRSAGW